MCTEMFQTKIYANINTKYFKIKIYLNPYIANSKSSYLKHFEIWFNVGTQQIVIFLMESD